MTILGGITYFLQQFFFFLVCFFEFNINLRTFFPLEWSQLVSRMRKNSAYPGLNTVSSLAAMQNILRKQFFPDFYQICGNLIQDRPKISLILHNSPENVIYAFVNCCCTYLGLKFDYDLRFKRIFMVGKFFWCTYLKINLMMICELKHSVFTRKIEVNANALNSSIMQ